MQKLVFCLDELIRTILRYRSPQDINLPYRLCQRSPFIAISPAGYASSTAPLPNPAMMPPPMYTTGPSPYYASAPAVSKPMETGYPESVCSSIPSLDSNASCESGQERSVLQESVFSRAEQNKQKDNQMQFLDQLEEEERKGKEAAKKEKERLEKKDTGNDGADTTIADLPIHDDQANQQGIATEYIEPVDKYEEKKLKRKKFWSGIGIWG